MVDLRMPRLNQVILAARLTRDPELRYLPSGTAVCELGLAHSEFYKGKDGEKHKKTLFIDAVTWANTAEFCAQAFSKGRPVIVQGELQSDEWEDRETGAKRSKTKINVTRIEALDWHGDGQKPADTIESSESNDSDEGDFPF